MAQYKLLFLSKIEYLNKIFSDIYKSNISILLTSKIVSKSSNTNITKCKRSDKDMNYTNMFLLMKYLHIAQSRSCFVIKNGIFQRNA